MKASSVDPELSDLGPLRTLAATAVVGGLTRSAIELGLAQSAASRHIRAMEVLFGGPLFHRTGRGMEPTDLLREVLPRVNALLAMAEGLASSSRALAGVPRGAVTLGLVGGVSRLVAPAIFAAVSERLPEIRLRFREGYSGEMEEALAQGRIDIAILNRYRRRGTTGYRKLFEAQLCAVGRPSLLQNLLAPLAGKASRSVRRLPEVLPARALVGLPLILPFAPNAMRSILEEHARRNRTHVNVAVECDSLAVMRTMLLEQSCIGVLPTHSVRAEIDEGKLAAIPLAESAFRQSVVLATSTQRPFTLAAKSVIDLIPVTMARIFTLPKP
jgi:DNA-binding transcriptional LysR family regulator